MKAWENGRYKRTSPVIDGLLLKLIHMNKTLDSAVGESFDMEMCACVPDSLASMCARFGVEEIGFFW